MGRVAGNSGALAMSFSRARSLSRELLMCHS